METKSKRRVYLFLACALLLATGCNPDAPIAPTASASATQAPILTAAPELTSTNTPTLLPSSTPLPTNTPTPTDTPMPITYGPNNFPAFINPLTGLPAANPEVLNRRPVMVKISNFPREGRPHAGIASADIIFDYYIGEGTNRYMALYYGEDTEKAGPIRSARLVDAKLVRLYQGIFGFAAADPYNVLPTINRQLGSRAITLSQSTCPALCDDGPHTVFSVFANTGQLSTYAAEKRNVPLLRPNLEGMFFSTAKPNLGVSGDQVILRYNAFNQSEWRYDETNNQYAGWIESVDEYNKLTMVPMTDRNNGKLVFFSNIIILFAEYTEYAPTLHDVDLWYNKDGKRMVLFRNGEIIEGTWKAVGIDQPLQFFTIDGSPLPLKPGNSWIAIAGTNSSLTQMTLGNWVMQFNLP